MNRGILFLLFLIPVILTAETKKSKKQTNVSQQKLPSFQMKYLMQHNTRPVTEPLKFQNDDPSSMPKLDLGLDALHETGLTDSEGTLLASTLDGKLVAIDQNTGKILWKHSDQPVVRSPYDSSKPVL